MNVVHLNIGSNQDRRFKLRQALKALEDDFSDIVVSSIFDSSAEGFEGRDFYNVGVNATTQKIIQEVVVILRNIETSLGRNRSQLKFSSRVIDLDLVLYNNIIDNQLNLPRDDILQYAFVLAPLAELNPQALHPVEGISYKKLWQSFQSKKDFQWSQYNIDKLFD